MNENNILIGTRTSGLMKSSNGGQNWYPVTDHLTIPFLGCRQIIATNSNPNRILALSGYDVYDGLKLYMGISGIYLEGGQIVHEKARVLKSVDGGLSFTDYSEGLPDLPVDEILTIDSRDELIFCATAVGIYYRTNSMDKWECFSNKLPEVEITNLQFDYCSKELYASTYGRGLWKSKVPFFIGAGGTQEITSNTTWSSPTKLTQNLLIKTGSTLTVTTTVNIQPELKIMIEPGAQLIVDGGTLTNQCGEYWNGIEVWGNTNLSQAPGNQGTLICKNNATISFARTAITNWKENNWNSRGGIIYANNTNFINNQRSAAFMQYHNFTSTGTEIQYKARFIDCNFIWNNAYNRNFTLQQAITLWSVNGITISGCTFDEQQTGLLENQKHSGVYGLDAKFNVIGRVLNVLIPPVHTEYNATGYDISLFKNMRVAVEANNAQGVVVDHVNFENCYKGVVFSVINDGKIARNKFYNSIPFSPSPTVHVTIAKSDLFRVEGNIFETNNTNLTSNVYGVLLDNASQLDNKVFRNRFIKMGKGAFAQGENQNGLPLFDSKGITVQCNTFTNLKGKDIHSFVYNQNPTQGIKKNQGASNFAMNNSFSTATASSTVIFNYDNDKIDPINYFKSDAYGVNQTPVSIEGNVNVLNVSGNLNSCPSSYSPIIVIGNGQVSGLNFSGLTTQWNTINTIRNSKISEYNTAVQNGKDPVLMQNVVNMNNSNKAAVRALVESYSPYVSEEVLRELRAKPQQYVSSAWYRDILFANIERARDNASFMTYLEANIPNGHYLQIKNALYSTNTAMGIKENEIIGYTRDLTTLSNAIIDTLLSDSIETNWPLYQEWLLKRENPLEKTNIADMYTASGKSSEMNSIANQIEQDALEISSLALRQEMETYASFKKFLARFYFAELMAKGIPKDKIPTLRWYRDNTQGLASYEASNILCFFAQECKEITPASENKSAQAPVSFDTSQAPFALDALIISPNPAKGLFTVQLSEEKLLSVLLIDAQGKQVNCSWKWIENSLEVSVPENCIGLYKVLIKTESGTQRLGTVLLIEQ